MSFHRSRLLQLIRRGSSLRKAAQGLLIALFLIFELGLTRLILINSDGQPPSARKVLIFLLGSIVAAAAALSVYAVIKRQDTLLKMGIEELFQEVPQSAERFVNIWFSKEANDKSRIGRTEALVLGESVYLRVNIGRFDKRSILTAGEPFVDQDTLEEAFPELKGKPIPVDITLFGNDFDCAGERTLTVHLRRDRQTESVYFRLTPRKKPISYLRVCLFYRNHLLQSIGVRTRVIDDPPSKSRAGMRRQDARVELAFSADFTRVEAMPARGLWLGLNRSKRGSHTLNVKGDGLVVSRNLENKVEAALRHGRKALLQVSFDTRDENGEELRDDDANRPLREYRFNADNYPKGLSESGQVRRFKEDLTRLAAVGSRLYEAIFGAVESAEDVEAVAPLVEKLEEALRDEQVIQVARLKAMEDIWPWALVYDLPIIPDKVKDVCLAFRGEGGRPLPYKEGIKRCKHRDPDTGYHLDETVVCPYGFWGIKHIIEQPTRHGEAQAFEDLVTCIGIPAEPVLQMPLANSLLSIERDHINRMQRARFRLLRSLRDIKEALDPKLKPPPPEPHILYFFCHGKYDSNGEPFLQIGDDEALLPSNLRKLKLRWRKSRCLVFINGCHTADLEPKHLSEIMSPFVNAYASGVVGTEITVHTFLAREFAQKFFERLIPDGGEGQRIGQIIRDIRMELLMKYNPLGLVYTPYCSADLHLVQVSQEGDEDVLATHWQSCVYNS